MRWLVPVIAVIGFGLSIGIYLGSFLGAQIETIGFWWLLLFAGLVVVLFLMHQLEYPASKSPFFSLKGFAQGMPRWVIPFAWAFAIFAVMNFAWMAWRNGAGVPEIVDGQFVLESRGHILAYLTQGEYLSLQADDLRGFASLFASLYFAPMMYFLWLPWRKHAREPVD